MTIRNTIKTLAVAAAFATGLAATAGAQSIEEPGARGGGIQGPSVQGPKMPGPGTHQIPGQRQPGLQPRIPGQPGIGRPVYANPRTIFVGQWILTDQRGRRIAVVFGPRGKFVISGGQNGPKVVGLYTVRGTTLVMQARFVCTQQGCSPRQQRPIFVRYRVVNSNFIQTSNGTLQRARA